MGYKSCSVLSFKNYTGKKHDISFHMTENPEMRNKWLAANAIGINQRCDDSFRVLMKQSKSENSNISKKEVYHLFHPRQECVDIVSRCERKLKYMSKKDFKKNFHLVVV